MAAAIEAGPQRLSGLTADVVLMDLQYTRAMVDKPEKRDASNDMVSRIAAAAEKAKVNVFRRFALMRCWVGDGIRISSLEDGADDHLHTGEWATGCVAEALADAIERTVRAEAST